MRNPAWGQYTKYAVSGLIVLLLAVETADAQMELKDGQMAVNFDWKMVGDKRSQLKAAEKKEFKNAFEQDLKSSLDALTKKVQRPEVVAAIKASNIKNKDLPISKIMEIDSRWKSSSADDPLFTELLDKSCNKTLVEFKNQNQEFAEVFVTDSTGLNVCQTNKTTDYYQADENWWKDSMKSKKAQPSHGQLEYDQSAETFAIAIYVPVLDQQTQKVIGLSKGIVRKKFGS